jgi:hypothetical protein
MIRALPVKSVRQALAAKGFHPAVHGARDHEMFFLHHGDRKTDFFVKISRGAREMRRDEISNNARQVRVAGDQLFRVLCCEYGREQTLELCLARPKRD